MKEPAVYILASKYKGTLYVGVTSNLIQRVWQHKQGVIKGFTDKYHVKKLVYYEQFIDMQQAIIREKQLKAGSRKKKVALIETMNPYWADLYEEIIK